MGSEWEEVSLGDLFKVKHGFAFKSKYFTEEESKYLLVTPGNFSTSGGFQNIKQKFYGGVIPEDYILQAGDIIITMTDLSKMSDTLGYAAIVPNDDNVWLHNQRIGLLEFKNSRSYPKFISYFLRNHEYRSWVIGSATGTTVKHTSPSRIESFECKLPLLPEQKAIAHILGTLDDKIELNRQMNETLEAMAQALFKSWFVDFYPVLDNAIIAGNAIPDAFAERAISRKTILAEQTQTNPYAENFPSEFEFTDELGWIPKGWEIKELGEITSEIIDHRGKTPKKLGGDWVDSGHPAISAKNIKNGQLIRHDAMKYLDAELYKKWMKIPLQKGDFLITSEAPLGEMLYLNNPSGYVLSQRLYGIRADKKFCSGLYLYYWMNSHKAITDLNNRATGTTVTGIRQSELRQVVVLCPFKSSIGTFSSLSESTQNKIDSNNIQATKLSKLRDTLLPQLLSGKLRIADAEKMVAELDEMSIP